VVDQIFYKKGPLGVLPGYQRFNSFVVNCQHSALYENIAIENNAVVNENKGDPLTFNAEENNTYTKPAHTKVHEHGGQHIFEFTWSKPRHVTEWAPITGCAFCYE